MGNRIMTLDSIFEAAGNLLIITAINAVVIFGGTFLFLCIRDKLAKRKPIIEKSKRK
jgi:hypothetical protein